MGQGAAKRRGQDWEGGRGGWAGEGQAGGAPPPVRYQSTAESRTHARITAQGLASREASRGRLLPTSAQAQRLPISPPQSGANRRGQLPYRSVATAGADAQESACALWGLARGGGAGACRARAQEASAPPPRAHAPALVRGPRAWRHFPALSVT